MQDIRAWRRPQEGGLSDVSGSPLSAVGGSPLQRRGAPSSSPASPTVASEGGLGPARLTELFRQSRCLDFADLLEDGFRDIGAADAAGPGAVVVVDRREDECLAEFLDRASKKILRASDVVTRVMVAALLVSETLGRSSFHASAMQGRHEQLVMERADPATGAIRLGDVMHDLAAPGGSKGRQPGAGGTRHRALLLKAVADWLHIAPCSLHGDAGGAAWNVLLVDGEPFVLDVMFDPGALYIQSSGRADEYLRRAAEAAPAAVGRRRDSTTAPSMQPSLGGRMLRPSWHVEPWEIEFDRRDRAGRGGFGEVFQGTWAGQATAVKEVRDANPTDGDVCDFILEISLLSRLSHPNVVRFWRGCVDLRGGSRTLLLVTEWMDRGVLSSLLHESQEPEITAGQLHVLAVGIAMGVAYLHEVKILHLDLKSPNVLLNSAWHPKLCDFGLAKLREQTALHTTLRGVSPIWAPPEMFDDKTEGLTEKADVYSFGIILFELAARRLPFADVSQMQLPRVKAKGQLPKFPDDMERSLAELTRSCLCYKPAARPSMQEAIESVRRAAKERGLDLLKEQVEMEQRGLHLGASAGGTPNAEQLRRAEAEKRRAELEVARLRRLLEDEEARVRALEAEAAGGGAARALRAPGDEARRAARAEEFCASRTQVVEEGSKFRCAICRKLFRGAEFVHKHIREKHAEEMLAFGAGLAPAVAPGGAAAAGGGDSFFDGDVAEESNALTYTKAIGKDTIIGGRRFSQAFQDAFAAGDMLRVQQNLLQGGCEVNQADIDGSTPLHLSARLGHVDCVQYLLVSSGNLEAADESGYTPLHTAAMEGQSSTCPLLLEAGACVDALDSVKQRSPLHLAAAGGHREVCRMLLMHKAAVSLQDADGESPLHNAARFGDRELCEVILSFGAGVSVCDKDGWTPLHEAARWGDGELVESLLQRGADVLARSNDGEGCLHVVPGGYAEFEVVEVLLAWKCDVNARDYDGETCLHVAVRLGDAELAGVFLNNGADANATNAAGATPLDFAKKDEVRWLLRSHKARRGAGAP